MSRAGERFPRSLATTGCRPFHGEGPAVTWEGLVVRGWAWERVRLSGSSYCVSPGHPPSWPVVLSRAVLVRGHGLGVWGHHGFWLLIWAPGSRPGPLPRPCGSDPAGGGVGPSRPSPAHSAGSGRSGLQGSGQSHHAVTPRGRCYEMGPLCLCYIRPFSVPRGSGCRQAAVGGVRREQRPPGGPGTSGACASVHSDPPRCACAGAVGVSVRSLLPDGCSSSRRPLTRFQHGPSTLCPLPSVSRDLSWPSWGPLAPGQLPAVSLGLGLALRVALGSLLACSEPRFLLGSCEGQRVAMWKGPQR